MTNYPPSPAYLPDGTCRFCQAPTRFGGAPHAKGCAYFEALQEITENRYTVVESAAVKLAEARMQRAAQRKAAAERIAEWKKENWDNWTGRCQDHVDTYVQALQDTGILGPEETEADLLKEIGL